MSSQVLSMLRKVMKEQYKVIMPLSLSRDAVSYLKPGVYKVRVAINPPGYDIPEFDG